MADARLFVACCRAQVPYRLLKAFHRVQQRLVRELEKKFSGKDVVLIGNRRILRAPTSGKSNARPRSRTLTAVRARTHAHASCMHAAPLACWGTPIRQCGTLA